MNNSRNSFRLVNCFASLSLLLLFESKTRGLIFRKLALLSFVELDNTKDEAFYNDWIEKETLFCPTIN